MGERSDSVVARVLDFETEGSVIKPEPASLDCGP